MTSTAACNSLSCSGGTARVAIEDGAYFWGGIDIRREDNPAETPQVEGSVLDRDAEEVLQAEGVGV